MKLSGLLGRSWQLRRELETKWNRLYRLAYAWCHDSQLASDLVQEALAKALDGGEQLRNAQALDAWLFTILANCWRDYNRRNPETTDIDGVTLVHASNPEEESGQLEMVSRVRAAIAGLGREQRQVITLVDLEGFAYGEVAQVLGIPVGTVMSRLCRARRDLKRRLQTNEDATRPRMWSVK